MFEQNRAAIARRNPALAERLADASVEGVELVSGPRGATSLRERGVLLGSTYDPVRDGERLAAQMVESPADVLVAVGFGLGEQLEACCARHPGTVIVYEPSLARLKAALCRFSIAPLLASRRDLHLVTDLDAFTTLLNARYVPGLCIRVFPHPAVLRLDPKEVAAVVDRTKRIKDSIDTRVATSVSQLAAWAWITAGNGRRIAESADFGRLQGAFKGKPAVVAAAGPSLDKQLPILRAWRDRVVVIAIGQTLKSLRQAGIEPDLVHVLESKDVSHQLTDAGETRDLCLALTPDAHPAIYDVPARALFTATTGASPMGTWIASATGETRFTMGGGTVAQGAVGLAVLMGCSPILLIGQDLAFTDGRAYARDSAYGFVNVDLAEDGTCGFTDMKQKASLIPELRGHEWADRADKGRVVWVDGWNEGERVPTWRAYAAFIEQYRDIGLGLAKAGFRLVNCTEGGARIPMVEHRPFLEVLETLEAAPLDARSVLLDVYDTAPRRTLDDYRAALATARTRLDELEREVAKGRDFETRQRARLGRPLNDQQRLEMLRGVARAEKKIRRILERAVWLDALIQPEIFAALASQRRSDGQTPEIEALLAEAHFLIEAAGNGVLRARAWFDHFEQSFAEAAASDEAGDAASPSADAPTSPSPSNSTSGATSAGRPAPSARADEPTCASREGSARAAVAQA